MFLIEKRGVPHSPIPNDVLSGMGYRLKWKRHMGVHRLSNLVNFQPEYFKIGIVVEI